MEIRAQKDMFLRSTPMPLDYMHMPPSMRMTSPVM